MQQLAGDNPQDVESRILPLESTAGRQCVKNDEYEKQRDPTAPRRSRVGVSIDIGLAGLDVYADTFLLFASRTTRIGGHLHLTSVVNSYLLQTGVSTRNRRG